MIWSSLIRLPHFRETHAVHRLGHASGYGSAVFVEECREIIRPIGSRWWRGPIRGIRIGRDVGDVTVHVRDHFARNVPFPLGREPTDDVAFGSPLSEQLPNDFAVARGREDRNDAVRHPIGRAVARSLNWLIRRRRIHEPRLVLEPRDTAQGKVPRGCFVVNGEVLWPQRKYGSSHKSSRIAVRVFVVPCRSVQR